MHGEERLSAVVSVDLRGKSCLTDLTDFYNGRRLGRQGESSWVDAVYLEFRKAFDTVFHNILTGNLRKRGLDEWTLRWTENSLHGRAQRVMTSGTKSSGRPVASGFPHKLVLGLVLFNLSVTWMK